jgi:hypothetical protein
MIAGTLSDFDSESVSLNVAQNTLGVRTSRQTEVSGSLARNATVGVRANLRGDGSLMAARITAGEASIQENRLLGLRGVVDTIGSSSLVLKGGQVVMANSATVVVSQGKVLSFKDLKPGDLIGLTGSKQADGSILAAGIEVIPAPPVLTTVQGVITSTGSSFFTIGAAKVLVDGQTIMVSKGGPVSLSAIKIGDQATAVGIKQSDGSLLAMKIELVPPAPVLTTVRGTVTSIGSSYFMIGATKVTVSSQTVIVSKGKIVSFADLKSGDQVAAIGTKQADGSLLAMKIELIGL